MKKNILAALILASFLLASAPASATSNSYNPTPTPSVSAKEDRQLKIKLLNLKRKQAVTKYKIKRNIVKAKANIKRIKKTRIIEKKRRAATVNRTTK